MTEEQATALARKIIADPDGYTETVQLCEDELIRTYTELSRKYPHSVCRWRMNALQEQLEKQHEIKLGCEWR